MSPRLARKPGTQPLDPSHWIERDEKADAEIAYRRRLISERRNAVFAQTSGSEPAQAELYAALTAHLGTDGPPDPSPLVRAGSMVQEDFCILEQREAGAEYILSAAILCFPSRWSLAEKIGHPLTAIHDPVPDYTDGVGKRVNRLFEAIKPAHPLWRANWTVHSSDELHQPSDDFRAASDPNAPLYIRVERQTFIRLPKTQAVIFGIRTYIDPLTTLSRDEAAGLHAALSELTEDEVEYRGGEAMHRAALDQTAE